MDFKTAAILGTYISKDYAEDFFKLLVNYHDISASEAASRLGLHIRTAQDFLDAMASLGTLNKVEVYEKKRPYFRYSLQTQHIQMEIDLTKIEKKRSVYLWGGAGKAGTFLHHCKTLAPKLMEKLVFAVDINPKKVGKYLPSSLVKIASKDEFFAQAMNDDFLIIVNPIYTNEIMEELKKNNLSDIEIFLL